MVSQGLPPVLIERLGEDHARIAGIVAQLKALLDDLTPELDWRSFSELLEFLEYYADRVHHPLEDRLFDHLVNKGLTPVERRLVFKNLGQHEEIKALTETLIELSGRALAGSAVDEDEFRDVAAAYVGLQHRHMRFEESHLFPLLEAEFDNKDWNALMGILEHSPEATTRAEVGS